MQRILGILISGVCILIGLVLLYLGVNRPITIIVDGEQQIVWTRAITAGQALKDAKINYRYTDIGLPGNNHWLGWNGGIRITTSRLVFLSNGMDASLSQGGKPGFFWSTQRLPGNLMAEAGIRLYPGDQLYWQGLGVLPGKPLPEIPVYYLQYQSASHTTVSVNKERHEFYSIGGSLGKVLWENGFHLNEVDSISYSLDTPLPIGDEVTLKTAIPLTIQIGPRKLNILSSASTVGQALAQTGIALQDLDFSKPAENQSLPKDGKIKVVRVQEKVTLEQTQIPIETEYLPDPETELDQTSVIDAGQVGNKVTRVRIRYEDGKETEKVTEGAWIASQPRNRKIGYGTKVIIRSLDTPEGKVQYWRAITVYATAYSPCGLGNVAKCYYGTSIGLPVKRGVIAVIYKWYLLMGGQPVFVPGYGKAIIADVGGGIPGKDWIDLGFTDSELEEWHQNVVLYFLTPVPADIPWILP